MKYFFSFILISMFVLGLFVFSRYQKANLYGAPPYIDEDANISEDSPYPDFSDWKRPDGPLRVGLQAGHWKTSEMPDELAKIRDNGGGTSRGNVAEWEVVLKIAEKTKSILEAEGIVVDILPATVPVDYWADAFISIHADGSLDTRVSGYKIAPYRRDQTGIADDLSSTIERVYGEQTSFTLDTNITKNMTGYYAFNWRRYDHAVHPMTPSVLLETGFLTNYSDANILINKPEIPAKALASGIKEFLATHVTLD